MVVPRTTSNRRFQTCDQRPNDRGTCSTEDPRSRSRMPRAVRESDEEIDTKPGRRLRNLTETVDPGRRRSTRLEMNKQESSPEVSPTNSSIQTRAKRRTIGQQVNDNVKSLRPRLNSISSDVSEKDDTPKTRAKNAASAVNSRRSSRLTRASSEVNTPSPVTRTMRRTRANSMEPESRIDNQKGKKVPLTFPSEATVVEEMEETMMNPVVSLERTLAVQVKSKTSLMTKRRGAQSPLEEDRGVEDENLVGDKEIPKLDDDEKENRGDSNKEAKQSFNDSLKKEDNQAPTNEDNTILNERWKSIVDDDTESLKDNCIAVNSVDSSDKSLAAISKSQESSENENTKESIGNGEDIKNTKESIANIGSTNESIKNIGNFKESVENIEKFKESNKNNTKESIDKTEDLKVSTENTGHFGNTEESVEKNSIESEKDGTMSHPLKTEKNIGDSAENFFKDIPLREWSQQVDKLSELSASTEKLNDESEAECNLVFEDSVPNSGDSDSDNTVVLQKSRNEEQNNSSKNIETQSSFSKTQKIKEVQVEEEESCLAKETKAMNSSKTVDDESVEKNDLEKREKMEMEVKEHKALNKSTERVKEYLEKLKDFDGKKKLSMGEQEDRLDNKSTDINEESKEPVEKSEDKTERKEKVVAEEEKEHHFEAVNKSTEINQESKGFLEKSEETVDPEKYESMEIEKEEDCSNSSKKIENQFQFPRTSEMEVRRRKEDYSKLTEKSSSKSKLEENDLEEQEKMEVEEDCSKINKSTEEPRETEILEKPRKMMCHREVSSIDDISEAETVINESAEARTVLESNKTAHGSEKSKRTSTNDEINDSDYTNDSRDQKTLSESRKTNTSRETPRKISTNDELTETEAKNEFRKTVTVPELNKTTSARKKPRKFCTDDESSETDLSSYERVQLPKFLFRGEKNSDSEEGSIDSDVRKEYNLDGDDEAAFSNDDVPGDECRVSETESSDPNDDGSDLKDFVVDDDEVEESLSEEEKSKNGEDDSEESEVDLFDDKEKSRAKKMNRGKNQSRIEESEEESEDQETDLIESKSEINAKRLKKGKKMSRSQDLEDSDDEQADLLHIKSKAKDRSLNKSKNKSSMNEEDLETLELSKSNERNRSVTKIIEASPSKSKDQSLNKSKNKSRMNEKDLETLELSKSNERNRSVTKIIEAYPLKSKDQSLNESKNKSRMNEEDLETFESTKSNERNKSITEVTETPSSEPKENSSPCRRDSTEEKFLELHGLKKSTRKLRFTAIVQSSTPKMRMHKMLENNEIDEGIDEGAEELSDSKLQKEDGSFLHRSLPTVVNANLALKTNLSRSISNNVSQLNRTEFVKDSDTPNTKFLKKDKLNESAPALKLNVQDEENRKENRIEEAEASDERLKETLFKVAKNILENEQRMNKKKKKKDKRKIATSNIQEVQARDDADRASKPKKKKKKDNKKIVEAPSRENGEGFLRKTSQNLQNFEGFNITENSCTIPSKELIVQKSNKMKSKKKEKESEETGIIFEDGIEYVEVDLPLDIPKKKNKPKLSRYPEFLTEIETGTKSVKKRLRDSRFDLPIAGTSKPNEKKSKNTVKTNVNLNSSNSYEFPTLAFFQPMQESLNSLKATSENIKLGKESKIKKKNKEGFLLEENGMKWKKERSNEGLNEVSNKKRKLTDSEQPESKKKRLEKDFSTEENYGSSTTKFDILPLNKLKSKKKRFEGDSSNQEDYEPSVKGSTTKFDTFPLSKLKSKKNKNVLVSRRC
ncbi:uncharacterized protein PFB0145c-like [Ceratina calcarata]|uniref:Uncharacterized protein PFB0145c-like n=1 Tax=Ceratina calcarata TaxID=156304 RepID=A0AAJ7J741_9HYME|nr:uncharacterized protein PFB0145c-like [Ceratina calcarata]